MSELDQTSVFKCYTVTFEVQSEHKGLFVETKETKYPPNYPYRVERSSCLIGLVINFCHTPILQMLTAD